MKPTPQHVIDKIIKARSKGYKQSAIAEALGITQATVSIILKRHGMTGHIPATKLDINAI